MRRTIKTRVICLLAAGLLICGLPGCGGRDIPDEPPVTAGGNDVPAMPEYDPKTDPAPEITKDPVEIETPDEPEPAQEPATDPTTPEPVIEFEPEPVIEPVQPEPVIEPSEPGSPGEIGQQAGTNPVTSAVNPLWFEDSLSGYLREDCEWENKSYTVSPASFRAALCLAIEGARDDTRDGLLQAAGFESYDEMVRWYQGLLNAKAEFEQARAVMDEDKARYENDPNGTGMAFHIANAVWDNLEYDGGFQDAYVRAIEDKYQATASASPADQITNDVNRWCDENTNGMIKSIAPDLSKTCAVLANALYIKSGWSKAFSEYYTSMDKFAMPDGSTVDLEFMRQTDDFRYAADPDGKQYAAFNLYGDIWFQVCLDTNVRPNDFFSALYRPEWELLDVKMPKLDLETTLGEGMLNRYLIEQGAGAAFGDAADFSAMTDRDGGWHIDDIIQKTRLKTDEDGMEAAAVTAILMADNAMVGDAPSQPIPFYMDCPFSFLITKGIYGSDSGSTILFFGQYTGQ